MSNFIDLTGNKYNLLTVLSREENKNGKTYWRCLCDCGKEVVVESYNLKSGNTKSCGCIKPKSIRNAQLKDLTGNKFGFYEVLELDEIKNGIAKWKCKCVCGEIKSVYGTNLTRGLSKSCGCKKSEILKQKNIKDLSGEKYGRLTVLGLSWSNKNGDCYFKCQCDCGNEKIIRGQYLKTGRVKSCGCLTKERIPANKTHGMSKTRLFKIWSGMKQRCYNPNNNKYSVYGGRGIRVCDDWIKDFISFKEWAMKNGYSENLSIDRIEPNGNYEPSNCRWATMEEQANNTRKTIFLEHNGERRSIAEWSKITGISKDTLYQRKRMDWKDAECIERKVGDGK